MAEWFYNVCENPGSLKVLYLLKNLFSIALLAIPIIIIARATIDFVKPAMSGETSDLKRKTKELLLRSFLGIMVFLGPTVIMYMLYSFTGDDTLYEVKQCTANLTIENIKYYEKIYDTYMLTEMIKIHPTKSSIENARKKVDEINSWAKEDHIVDFYNNISQAEIKLKKEDDIRECAKKHGNYRNGYCFVPEPKPSTNGGGSGNSSTQGGQGSTDYNPSNGGSGTTTIKTLGNTWTVLNSKTSVTSYSNHLKNKGVRQNANDAWGDKCLGFSYTHAYGLYTNNKSYTGKDGAGYTGASKFTVFVDDNKQAVLKAIYNEINAGRPCVLQVNGNKKGTSRHYVTVVGYKSNVRSGDTITEDDLLIIDSWDAKLETMDGSSSRFMISGKDCRKKYSGYQMYYLK
jgi:hypothetical protein